jgi:hypothetical protein
MKELINMIDIVLIWVAVANVFINDNQSYDFYFRRCFNIISVAY